MMSTNCIPKPEGPPCTDSLEFAWSTMKPIKIGTAQADVCRLTYVGEPGMGFNRIEKYFASFEASFGPCQKQANEKCKIHLQCYLMCLKVHWFRASSTSDEKGTCTHKFMLEELLYFSIDGTFSQLFRMNTISLLGACLLGCFQHFLVASQLCHLWIFGVPLFPLCNISLPIGL